MVQTPTQMMDVQSVANDLLEHGLSVIPVNGKTPALPGWKEYQERVPDVDELNYNKGIALVCGEVSGGVECIDVDTKNDTTGTLVKRLREAVFKNNPEFSKEDVVTERTPSGGLHIVYKCPVVEGNQVLAKSNDQKTLIETRGRGGYFVIAPSPGYELLNGDFANIPIITSEQRDSLLTACRSLDECWEESKLPFMEQKSSTTGGVTPWIDFNQRGNAIELLEKAGWTFVESSGVYDHYRRPGKSRGNSGSWNRETKRFKCFTSSTNIKTDGTQSPAALFAYMECNGDFAEAGRKLRELGFGVTSESQSTEPPQGKSLSDFEQLRITDATQIPQPKPVITIAGETISTRGDITAISGQSKVGKSALMQFIISAAITHNGLIENPIEELGGEVNSKGLAVIHIDTEQARWKHQQNISAILGRAMLTACPDHFLSYNIRQLPLQDYKAVTNEICNAASKQFDGIFLIVVDGIADYVTDVNDVEQSNSIVKEFMEISEKHNCPVICIIHMNPGGDKERGHLGSEIQRKAGSILAVKKDGEVSYVEPRLLRYAGIGNLPVLQFQYDIDKGYHVGVGTRSNGMFESKGEKQKQLKEIASKALRPSVHYAYNEVVQNIKKVTNKQERVSKDRFTEMHEQGIIIKDSGSWMLNDFSAQNALLNIESVQ